MGGNSASLSSPLITTLLKGVANLSHQVECPAPPLPRRRLLQLCDALRGTGPDRAVMAAACLFGVATMLRQSNFLPTQGWGISHLLHRSDVKLDMAGLHVTVSTTKTLSLSQGGVVIPVAWVPGSPYCPVRSCMHAWGLCPGGPGVPLFLLPSTGRPLTPQHLTAMSRAALTRGGWPLAPSFTVHSLRRTGAHLAAMVGASEADLMTHGTWRSSAIRA